MQIDRKSKQEKCKSKKHENLHSSNCKRINFKPNVNWNQVSKIQFVRLFLAPHTVYHCIRYVSERAGRAFIVVVDIRTERRFVPFTNVSFVYRYS